MPRFDGGPEIAEHKATGFHPGDMVEILANRRGISEQPARRFGVVVSTYKPTGARWITRLEVLVDGKLEDINVCLLKKIRKRKTSGV